MAKFYGAIGYGETVESRPGVWEDVITEKFYYGDVLRNTRKLEEGEGLNKNLTINNSISIVADPYINNHFHNIRYVQWMGARWTISNIEVKPDTPRLILRIGEVYNGPTPKPEPEPTP